MVPKTGKLVCAMLLIAAPYLAAVTARLQYFDMYGSAIKQAQVGVPLRVVLTVEGELENVYTDDPATLPGFDKAKLLDRQEATMRMFENINGVNKHATRLTFTFLVQFDTQGAYAVGPYKTTLQDGTQLESNPLYILVADEPIYTQNKQKQAAELALTLDKKKVYYGQKVLATLQFLYAKDVEQLQCQPPLFDDFFVKDRSVHSRTGTVEKDGTKYKFHEWQFELYPTKLGTTSISSAIAQFAFVRNSRGFFDHAFFDFFGGNTHQVRSLPTAVEVMPLPKSEKYSHVTAVGSFDSLTIKLKSEQAEVGEGLVLALELVGDGNMGMIEFTDFTLPKEFKWYSANTVVEPLGNGKDRKRFEFIVQGLQPGTYTIPAQKLVYFNPSSADYYELKSNEISCTITGQAKPEVSDADEQTDLAPASSGADQIALSSEQELQVLLGQAGMYTPIWYIPVAWFNLVLILLLCILLAYCIYISPYYQKLEQWSYIAKIKNRYNIRKSVAQAKKSGSYAQLLRAVEYACVVYLKNSSYDVVVQTFTKLSLSEEQQHRMIRFYKALIAHVYHKDQSEDFQTMCGLAFEFIQNLEEIS